MLNHQIKSKEDEIGSVVEQLEKRSEQQRQLLKSTHDEVDLYKQQLEQKKQQARQFLENKQNEFFTELQAQQERHKKAITQMEQQRKNEEEAWVQRVLDLETHKFTITQKVELLEKESTKAKMEATSLKQMLATGDEQLRQLASNMTKELTVIQSELIESQNHQQIQYMELHTCKEQLEDSTREVARKNEEITSWKDKYFDAKKRLDTLVQDISDARKTIEDHSVVVQDLKDKIKEAEHSNDARLSEMMHQWEDKRRKMEDLSLREWKKKIKLEIEVELSNILEVKLQQLDTLIRSLSKQYVPCS